MLVSWGLMAMQTSFFEEMKRLVVRASTSIAYIGVLAPLMVTHVSVSSYVQQRYLAARVEWVPRDLRNADGSPWVEQRSVRRPLSDGNTPLTLTARTRTHWGCFMRSFWLLSPAPWLRWPCTLGRDPGRGECLANPGECGALGG